MMEYQETLLPKENRDSGPAIRVSDLSSESSDNSQADTTPTTDFVDHIETAGDGEGGDKAATPVAEGDEKNYYDHKKQVFKMYSGYGGGRGGSTADHPARFFGPLATGGSADGNGATKRATAGRGTTSSGAAAQSSTRGGGWMTVETLETTQSTVVGRSSSRNAVLMQRVVGECGRVHERDTRDWGPGRGWNVSTLPIYRSPGSPCNRLFRNMTESRSGREPKALLERQAYYYAPQPSPLRNRLPDHLRFGLHKWDPSTSLKQTAHRRKPHGSSSSSSQASSMDTFLPQSRVKKNVGHTSPPPQNAGSAGQGQSYHHHQHLGPKHSKVMKEWDLCTAPNWKVTGKCNQFGNIKDKKKLPRVCGTLYTGVKSQYKKPSKKFLRLREERQLEAQQREEYLSLDMKYYFGSHNRGGTMLNHKKLMQEIAQIAYAESR